MEKFMEKILPFGAPIPSADSIEYSFAIEYHGPPIPYEIPRVIPIEVEEIPMASVAAPASLLDPFSLPVVQPLPLKKPSAAASPTSVIAAADGGLDLDRSSAVESSGDLKESDRVATDSAPISECEFESSSSAAERDAVVAFDDDSIDSNGFVASPSSQEKSDPMVKKRSCYRCSKGNRFTEKEACLVCDAKYCSDCVFRAMGSMPEGRKCISCIGVRVMVSKREKLGKCSRMFRRLLSELEVDQVMRAEKYCNANQLRPEDVCVNGKLLSQEEMNLLLNCSHPPSKLKPGDYWYDKVSGLWGKEGQKPDKIISPSLNVGGSLMQNASNGTTGILINGREITKIEMQVLKWAGVQCAGSPHYWVHADGTYQEEGQKNIKGKIWGRAGTKLLCSFLSLPVPCKDTNPSGEEVNIMLNKAMPGFFEQRAVQKLLLVGYDGSGTSTIFKQAKFLYKTVPFSEDERQTIKVMIQTKVYRYLGILLEGRERFEEESLVVKKKKQSCDSSGTGNDEPDECDYVTLYSINPTLKAFSDWLLQSMESDKLEAIFLAATRATVEELWKHAAIQATYNRRSELQLLPSSASYLLERVVDISRAEYEPSDLDILHSDGITLSNGLEYMDFTFPQPALEGSGTDAADQQDPMLRYQLVRLPTNCLGENCKWSNMFEDIQIIIYCVAMSDYDEYHETADGVAINKMMDSKQHFESIISHQPFNQMNFLLVLNKFDLLQQKIDRSPLTVCDWFGDFNPVTSRHRPKNCTSESYIDSATKAQQAFHYIAVKFKRLFNSLTGRKLYVTSADGLNSESVNSALQYAREILKWEEDKPSLHEFSSSAFSHW